MSEYRRIVYDDEDNAPMPDDDRMPYPLRRWEDVIQEGKHEGIQRDQE